MARTITVQRAERIAAAHAVTLARLAADYAPLRSELDDATRPDDRVELHTVVTALGY